jgi:type II secretory pathway pseudopilin PulG
VTAEDIEAEQIQMENVTVTNLTVDLSDIQSSDSMLEDSFGSAIGGNVEGFMVDSIEIGSVQSASISIEDNTTTIDAEIESITLEGVSADRVTVSGSEMDDSMARPMLEGGALSFESITVQELSVGTITSEPAEAEPPTEPETPTPTETPTETETPTPDETPMETETPDETETPMETETPDETETPMETETPDETETPMETETPTPTEPITNGEGDGVVGGDGSNITDGEGDNVTVTEEASVTFEDQSSDGMVVNIANFTLPNSGYIAIHNDSLLDGDAVGSVIGVSEFYGAGTYENESVTLYNVSGANFTETQLTESQTLIAMPHQETNGNTTYDFVATNGTADGPYTSNGSAVTDAANVTVNETAMDGEEDNVTVDDEENVTVDDEENVTVDDEDNVTDGAAGGVGDNITDSEEDNVTVDDEENVTADEEDNVTVDDEDNVTAGEEDNVTAGEEDDVTANEEASVTFEDQTSDGMVVNIANFTVPDGGYIAIHNDSLLEGDAVGSVIGTSVFIDPGTYEDVNITLFDVPGANFTETQLTESQTLIAMPHQETGDNITYDFVATNGTEDGPYTSNGTAVTDAANVTVNETAMDGEEDNVTADDEDNVTDGAIGGVGDNVTADEEDNVTVDDEENVTAGEDDNVTAEGEAAVSFESQATNGTAVTIANFTLPDGGYIAIHNESLLEGDAVGSVIGASEFFEAGTFENESITLFNVSGANFTETQLNETQTLIAMPHQETNDNTTYDFVATNGTEDGPYTSNGTAVTDNATVATEAE